MDDDEKQMEGGRVSKLSGDYLPVTQVELSRCIVGKAACVPGLLRLESRSKREGCGGAAVSSGGGGTHVRCEIATAKKTNNL